MLGQMWVLWVAAADFPQRVVVVVVAVEVAIEVVVVTAVVDDDLS